VCHLFSEKKENLCAPSQTSIAASMYVAREERGGTRARRARAHARAALRMAAGPARRRRRRRLRQRRRLQNRPRSAGDWHAAGVLPAQGARRGRAVRGARGHASRPRV